MRTMGRSLDTRLPASEARNGSPRCVSRMRALLVAFMLALPGSAVLADDKVQLLPLAQVTPSHVHAIWVQVNALLIEFEAESDMRIRALKPRRFSGKKPADVLMQVELIRRELNKLRLADGLPAASISLARSNDTS